MSGHSKWHKVRQYKGAIDAKRGQAFTKMVKLITVAARLGGGDPEMNFNLRMAIDRAKAVNTPKDLIERAIKKGTGELEGGQIDEIVYEGFGPGQTEVIVVSLTDNRNRSVTEIRNIFTKNGGNMGGSGTVSWDFDRLGVIRITSEEVNKFGYDKLEEQLINLGVKDIKKEEEGVTILTEVTDLGKITQQIQTLNVNIADSGFEYLPKNPKQLLPSDEETLRNFLELLEDNDDVDQVFHNAM